MKKSKILILLLSITTVSILALGGKEKQDIKVATQIQDSTLEEVQEVKEYPSFMKELVVYKTEKNGELETVIYGNELDDFVTVTLNDFEKYYTMEYYHNDNRISYHCHSLDDLKHMLKLHQEVINDNYKDFEDITEGQEYYFYEFYNNYDNSQRGRKMRVNCILRIEEIQKDNNTFYSEYQNQWITLNDEEIEDREKQLKQYKKELIKYNGFDIDNNIDLELLYGKDWKCLAREQWLEMQRK